MKLAFSTWPEGTREKEFEETDESLELSKDLYRFPDPILVSLTIHKSHDEMIVEGRLSTTAYGECVRCLEEFPVAINETFRRVASVVPDSRMKDDTGDPDFTFLPESLPEWDFAVPLRELIVVVLPDNPLCQNDCRGLCPKCGANRNRESCNCNGAAGRNPLAQLGELLDHNRKTGS